MVLEKLHLINFKNYADAQIEFRGLVHCFLGKNGGGKTNLLEAIHYLSFTRGSFHAHDLANVRHGQDQFLINGLYDMEGKQMEVNCSFSVERKKIILENGETYSRFSEHLGKYPLVLVAPIYQHPALAVAPALVLVAPISQHLAVAPISQYPAVAVAPIE